MDLARPTPRPRHRTAVRALLGNVAMLHATRASQAGVVLRTDAPEDLQVVVDEGDLSRALDNLVRNALDVSTAGGEVVLAARRVATDAGDALDIAVTDQGPGFPADARAQAFTPFFTTKARGFGLGLCMVAAAADRAGGRVEIQDNIPRGARVVLHLPALEQGA
jgi:C4-dicarboxylate-specific signal transduction histidine kinase